MNDGSGGTGSIFRRDHNRDLKSKKEKIDRRSQPAMSQSNGLRDTRGEGNLLDLLSRIIIVI